MRVAQVPATPPLALAATLLCIGALALLWASAPVYAEQVEERHARHILVPTEADADALIERIGKGEDFVALCRKHSLDVVTKRLGGDLGWARFGMYPGMDKPLFAIEKDGGVAKAKTPYGWHVVQLIARRMVDSKPPPPKEPAKKKPDDKEPATRPAPPPKKDPAPQPGAGGTDKEKGGDGSTEPAAPAKDKEGDSAAAPPKARARPNTDITAAMRLERTAHHIGDAVRVTIELTNNTSKVLNVFNPDLWPLGIVLKYQGADPSMKNPTFVPPKRLEKPGDELYFDLDAKQTLARTFVIGDYGVDLQPWPVIRVIWRGDHLVRRLAATYPEIEGHAEVANWKQRWESYSSGVTAFDYLPRFDPAQRWFARFYINRGTVWAELSDPGVPGLLAYWIENVRAGRYARAPLSQIVANEFLLAGNLRPDESRPDKMFVAIPPAWKKVDPAPYSLALGIERFPDGEKIGPNLYVTLAAPKLAGSAVPIGKFQGGEKLLASIGETQEARRLSKPEITQVHLYTYEMLNEGMRKEIAGTDRSPGAEGATNGGEDAGADPGAAKPRLQKAGQRGARVELIVEDIGIVIELFEEHAPNSAANFVKLVDSGFYDELTFFRREENSANKGFMQGGSPTNDATGNAKYRIRDEITSKLSHVRGTVAMANIDGQPDSASCQFYICFDRQPQLDGKFTIFGRVVEGLEELERLPQPARIRQAKVVHRLDHPYVPETMPLAE